MPSTRNYEWPQWLITCTCFDDDGKPYRVREGCPECALDRAFSHSQLGHTPDVTPPERAR